MTLLPRSLKGVLLFYFTSIIVFTNGFMAVVLLSRENIRLYDDAVEKARDQMEVIAPLAAAWLSGGDHATMHRLCAGETERRPWALRIALFDATGRPLTAPGQTATPSVPLVVRAGMADGSLATAPSWLQAPTSRIRALGWVTQRPEGQSLVSPVASGAQVFGYVALRLPPLDLSHLHEAAWQVVITTIVNIAIGFSLALFVAQIILRPLTQLLAGLDAVRRGQYEQHLAIQGEGELAEIGRHFNSMAAALRANISEIWERNRELDEKVQELWEIYELTRSMGSTMDLRQILLGFMEKALTLSFSSYGQVLLPQPETGGLEVGVETPVFPRIAREVYETTLYRCRDEKTTVEIVTDHHTLVFLPLLAGREVQGVLFVAKSGVAGYSAGVRRFLETISPLGASLIANARLYLRVVAMHEYVTNVVDTLDAGILTVDAHDRIVTMNRALAPVLDLLAAPTVGRPLIEALAGVSDAGFVEAVVALLRGPDVAARRELALRARDGSTRDLSVRTIPMMTGTTHQGRLLVVQDLTSIKSIERQMMAAEKWVALGRLAASVAHEIRNPLVAVRGLVEMLRDDVSGESLQHTTVILGEVDRLNGVVAQLLQYARPGPPTLTLLSLDEMLDQLLLLIKHEAVRHRVEIVRRWPRGPVCARIDPEKLKQACLNVILNAIQAMPEGGELVIELREEVDSVQIRFIDRGQGIATTDMPRVGEPFFTTKTRGTGLGLAITRQILEQHLGRCDVDSQLGHGTTVTFVLPRPASSH